MDKENEDILLNQEREKLLARLMLKAKEAEKDPLIFIDNFCFTFNPKKKPYHLRFKTFPFQKGWVRELQRAIDTGYDIFADKCREMGMTYTTLAVFLWYWRYVPGSNFLLGSRKQDYVDNRGGGTGEVSNKEESLFGKLEYMLQRLPPFMLPKGFDIQKHFTYMSLKNPENGNVISGESSNPNFSRGGRFKAIFLDEYAFWDNDSSAWGSTADTTDCRIVVTTPGIKPSKAKRLRFGQDGEEIKVFSFSFDLDPRKTQEWIDKQRARRSAEDFAREIMINWEGSIMGIVYPEISLADIGAFPYNPNLPLYFSWDFGLDGVAIGYWQINLKNGKPRLVFSYTNKDKPIQWYLPFTGTPVDSKYQYTQDDWEAIQHVKDFKKGIHYGDPDVSKRSLLTGTSTRKVLQDAGVYVQTNPSANDFVIRREKTKVLLQGGIEVNKCSQNEYWLECIKNARYPQRTEASQNVNPINKPIHDWTSHHRTALEYFAVNYKPLVLEQDKPAWAEKLPSWGGSKWN